MTHNEREAILTDCDIILTNLQDMLELQNDAQLQSLKQDLKALAEEYHANDPRIT